MDASIVIDERFRGPPESGNGGYSCARVAAGIEGPCEVTLRAPPPLDTPLRIEEHDGGRRMFDGATLIAEAAPASVTVEVPDAISLEHAERASVRYPWRGRHPYPTCFVCGPRREEGDGLRVFPGPIDDGSRFAAPWTPPPSLADGSGHVADEFVWSALDCPSGIVTDLFGAVGRILLGRLAVDIRRPVESGRPHVVQAWTIDRDGRKLATASALYANDGELSAVGRALWIEVAGEAG